MIRARTLVTLLAITPMAAGCGGGGGGGATTGPTITRPASTATLAIVEPANEANVASGSLTVKLDLQGARIVETATTMLRPDEGHIHLSLDGKLVSMAYGLQQPVDVSPGIHVLVAEFVAGDHAPFNPRVAVTRTFAAVTVP